MDGLGGKGQRRKGDLVNENDQGLGASVEPGCLSQLPSVLLLLLLLRFAFILYLLLCR